MSLVLGFFALLIVAGLIAVPVGLFILFTTKNRDDRDHPNRELPGELD